MKEHYLLLGEFEEFVNEDCLEVVNLIIELLIELRKFLLVAHLVSTSLECL